jgi:hypothetical protein
MLSSPSSRLRRVNRVACPLNPSADGEGREASIHEIEN